MAVASWTMYLAMALTAAPLPSARWVGQDGHDLTSASKDLKPSDYQDIHVTLGGLPPEREITQIVIGGEGGGLWHYHGPPGSWQAALVRAPRSRKADLYFEPYCLEHGRQFSLKIDYDDGSKAEVYFKGGKADPNRRMPQAAMAARWAGQGGQDLVGTGPGVGPDGIQDARLSLTRLTPEVDVKWAEVEGPDGLRWHYGQNPRGVANAELVRDPKDRSRAELFFQADRDLAGKTLKVNVAYANERGDSAQLVAARFDPRAAMPRISAPRLAASDISGRWLGQDPESQAILAGYVHVAVSGLPSSRAVAGFVLTDAVFGIWAYRERDNVKLDVDPNVSPIVVRRGKDRSRVDLFFDPYRDESNTTLTLRVVFQDGSMSVARIAGGACDPILGVPKSAPTSTVARPGDDLHDLVKRFGTVTLAAGTHRLTRPLVLEGWVSVEGQRGAILMFEQGAGEPPWSTAIKIHGSRTVLKGFAVRFTGPIRWRTDVSYGPALIGTTDSLDREHGEQKAGLRFEDLDVEAPRAANPGGWEEAPRLLRLLNSRKVRIANNVFKGGTIEFIGGPFEIVDNTFKGTVPGTFNHDAIAAHYPIDLTVRGNHAEPVAPAGKTWRFLVMTNKGTNLRVSDNVIVGVGARDDDTIPWANAPEIILSESYRITYEGKLGAVSPDGLIVRIPRPPGDPAGNGDFVSILAGPHAGTWRKISQALGPTTYLLESPLPKGAEIVSISAGFDRVLFEGNTIDARGGKRASDLVLPGNHFGTIVRKNHFLGGEAFRIIAYASEAPNGYGWTHVPYLGGVFEENIIEDSPHGGILGVDHGPGTKSNMGRTYMSLVLRNNAVRWTDGFLRRFEREEKKPPAPGITIGYANSLDPGELVATGQGDRLQAPAGTQPSAAMKVEAAVYNGRRLSSRSIILPVDPLTPKVSHAGSK